jgi:GTP-binding protein
LNQALGEAVAAHAPASKKGRVPKFFYATQIAVQPPTILLFVNNPDLVTGEYERFLLNRFRDHLPFAEVPIRLAYRRRRERLPVDGERPRRRKRVRR